VQRQAGEKRRDAFSTLRIPAKVGKASRLISSVAASPEESLAPCPAMKEATGGQHRPHLTNRISHEPLLCPSAWYPWRGFQIALSEPGQLDIQVLDRLDIVFVKVLLGDQEWLHLDQLARVLTGDRQGQGAH
jgi:hypothetical protein